MANFKTEVAYNYDVLKTGQIFFSHGCDLVGDAITLGETGDIRKIGDITIPTHCGFIFDIFGPKFAAEINGGMRFDSLDHYLGKRNQIISVMEWDVFNDPQTLDAFNIYMATYFRKQQDAKYDLWGAIAASSWVHRLMPWIKQNPNKPFCSETVYSILLNYGFIFPLVWKDHPPNPLQVAQCLTTSPHIKQVAGFKTNV
jgi:hypothetical protein